MGNQTDSRIKRLLAILVIFAGIYWYSLDAPIAGTGITNFGALVLAFKASVGIVLILLGIAAVWVYSDRISAAMESENDLEKQVDELGGEEEEIKDIFDYDEIVSGTVDEVKQAVQESDTIEIDKVLEAESSGKDRKTLKEWLRSRRED